MTNVSQSAGARPLQARTPTPARGPDPAPTDVKAMKEAIASARGRMGPVGEQPREGKLGTPLKGKGDAKGLAHAKGEALAAPPQRGPAEEQPLAGLERRQERREQLEGFALPGQPGAPAPLPMPAMPNPQANPAAFAQMMADLWTRENGKGAKEVSVRFGRDAWPATGALLVRNAAGALDVTLYVGDRGQRYGGDLSGLKGALGDAGVDVGSLEMRAA